MSGFSFKTSQFATESSLLLPKKNRNKISINHIAKYCPIISPLQRLIDEAASKLLATAPSLLGRVR